VPYLHDDGELEDGEDDLLNDEGVEGPEPVSPQRKHDGAREHGRQVHTEGTTQTRAAAYPQAGHHQDQQSDLHDG
jgi:hypothetical protein